MPPVQKPLQSCELLREARTLLLRQLVKVLQLMVYAKNQGTIQEFTFADCPANIEIIGQELEVIF